MTEAAPVSVVIPAYNAARFLPDALDSVGAQTLPPAEVLVIDDGSTDATGALAQSHPVGARLIRQANAGSAAARNRGLHAATARYVAFLDADDVWEPDKLARQLAALAASGAAWAYTDAWWIGADGERHGRWGTTHPSPSGNVAAALLRGNFVVQSSVVAERAALLVVGGIPETRPGHASISEDWGLWLRLATDYPVVSVPAPLVGLRQHDGRKTATMDLDAALAARLGVVARAVARAPEALRQHEATARAAVHLGIARKWLERGEAATARRVLWGGLRQAPGHRPSLVFGVASLLSPSARRALGRVRAAYRARVASRMEPLSPPPPEAASRPGGRA